MKKPLTIDHVATKDRIKADGRTPASWCRLRGLASGTCQRIFNGSYPYQENVESEFQKILHALDKDGYLVQLGAQKAKAA